MEMSTIENLANKSKEMIDSHEREAQSCVEEMRQVLKHFLNEVGGCIQMAYRPALVYNSGRYGRMRITKLAIAKGGMILAYAEAENSNEKLWWSKPIEPVFTNLGKYYAIMDTIRNRKWTAITNPIKDKEVIWTV